MLQENVKYCEKLLLLKIKLNRKNVLKIISYEKISFLYKIKYKSKGGINKESCKELQGGRQTVWKEIAGNGRKWMSCLPVDLSSAASNSLFTPYLCLNNVNAKTKRSNYVFNFVFCILLVFLAIIFSLIWLWINY